jgi:hypothetical protein
MVAKVSQRGAKDIDFFTAEDTETTEEMVRRRWDCYPASVANVCVFTYIPKSLTAKEAKSYSQKIYFCPQ